MKFFSNTESANFCDGIEGSSSLDHTPFDVMGYVVPYEVSDMCTECGSLVFLILCIDV